MVEAEGVLGNVSPGGSARRAPWKRFVKKRMQRRVVEQSRLGMIALGAPERSGSRRLLNCYKLISLRVCMAFTYRKS